MHLLAKILKLPGKAARHIKNTLIVLARIQLDVRNDGFLSKLPALSGKVTIASGGVLPNFHAMLLLKETAEKEETLHPKLSRITLGDSGHHQL